MSEMRYADPLAQAEIDRLRATIARVEALAESMVWRRPDRSPCDPQHIETCCGMERYCDAMQPSVIVVGYREIRDALTEPKDRL